MVAVEAGYSDWSVDSGAGGSSYISGYNGCIAIKSKDSSEPKTDTYSNIEDSYHYSNLIFENAVILGGKETMPNYIEGEETITGNSGNGYARITKIK